MIRVYLCCLVSVVWAPLCCLLILLVRLVTLSERAAYAIWRFWARTSFAIAGVRFRASGLDGVDLSRPRVFVGNHPTNMDALMIMSVLPGYLSAVGTKELRRIPIVGWVMMACGWIFIDRQNNAAARRSIAAAGEKIRGGRTVLIFPEGRRTDTPRTLQKFKKGPFHLALAAGVPILPAISTGWGRRTPPGSTLPRPGEVTIRFGQEIVPTADDDVESLLERVRAEMSQLHREVWSQQGETAVEIPSNVPVRKLREWSEKTPNAPALYRCCGDEWESIDWEQYHRQACDLGASLVALGQEPGECVVILSANRVKWLVSQWGIMMAGGVTTPCYMTNPPEQVAYLIGHCRARFAFVENAMQLTKVAQVRDQLERFEKAIVYDTEGIDGVDGVSPDWVMSYEEFLALGNEEHAAELERRFAALEPEADAFIIYTSGTTGMPKAVVITHANLAVGGWAVLKHFPAERTRVICYLPLCHIAEQTATNLVQLETGGEVFMCPDFAKLPKYLPQVRPRSLFGVPRVWEKVEAVLESKFESAPPRKRKMIDWARRVETEAFEHKRKTGEDPRSFKRWLAHKLVLGKIKQQMGLEDVEYFMTGAAPISTGTLSFFASVGIRIHELYGLSETGGLLTATLPGEVAIGTVGKPLLGVEIELAEDGEILARGPGLSRGYLHDPEATAELWEGGWMHTGDIGAYDDNGNLRITDRKKDLIITAQAKNIAPQPIEAKLKRIPGVSQAVVAGDRRKYLIALFTVDQETAPGIAEGLGCAATDSESLSRDDKFLEYLKGQIDQVNKTLNRVESIKRFEVLPVEFGIDSGEMTPTLKVKRKVVVDKFAEVIDSVYARAH